MYISYLLLTEKKKKKAMKYAPYDITIKENVFLICLRIA